MSYAKAVAGRPSARKLRDTAQAAGDAAKQQRPRRASKAALAKARNDARLFKVGVQSDALEAGAVAVQLMACLAPAGSGHHSSSCSSSSSRTLQLTGKQSLMAG